jgi:hypothetical protein
MKWRSYLYRFITMNQKILSNSIEGVGSVVTHIIRGDYDKIIEDMETSLSVFIKKTEKAIKRKKVKKIQKKSRQKELREIGEEHDSMHDFEHIKYIIERKKKRLIELNTIQKLNKKYVHER